MGINAKKMLETAARGPERGPVHLYLDKQLYAEFKKACASVSSGKVLEQFMREFVESAKAAKK